MMIPAISERLFSAVSDFRNAGVINFENTSAPNKVTTAPRNKNVIMNYYLIGSSGDEEGEGKFFCVPEFSILTPISITPGKGSIRIS